MTNSVKQYIISRVFTHCDGLQVKENNDKDGFIFGLPVIIPSFVFDNIYANRAYFARHHVAWYISTNEFKGYCFEMPCIHFYDSKEV